MPPETTLTLTETVPIDSVFRDPANINVHNAYDLEEIAKSLKEFGQRTPIVVNKGGMIIKGNGTHEAAQTLLGWEKIWIARWECEDANAELRYAVADNATGRLSQFGADRLRTYLATETGTPGIPEEVRKQILAERHRRDLPGEAFDAEKAIEANPDATKVRKGDVWILGRHVLLCGESRDADQVRFVMREARATLVLTDPPYGVDLAAKNTLLNSKGADMQDTARCEIPIANDTLVGEDLRALVHTALKNAAEVSMPGAAVYVCAPQGENLSEFLLAFKESGFLFKWQLVWLKDNKSFGRSDYHFQHENILYGWKQDAAHYFKKRGASSVFQAPKPIRSREHGSMKPLELFEQIIENSSKPGDVVLDPFGGSGTTLRVCETTGRDCRMIEIEPHFCDLIIAKWEAETGSQAVLITNITPDAPEDADTAQSGQDSEETTCDAE